LNDCQFSSQLHLQPKQEHLLKLFEDSTAGWIGYGGARGGGKSAGARMVQMWRRVKHPGTRGLIFRRTYGQLYENHIEPLLRQFPELREYYVDKRRELRIPVGDGVFSSIVFGSGEHAKDIYSYLGMEYMDICVDQAEQLSEDELILLKTCNRWPGKDVRCRLALFANPGGVGHGFLKRVFIDRQYKGNERAEDYTFLQAYGWDNVEWCRAMLDGDGLTEAEYYDWPENRRSDYFIRRSDYGRGLDRLPESVRNGHLFGRWDVFAGQYFDNFDPARHLRRPEEMAIQGWHPRWIAIDWGFRHDAVAHWCAQDGVVTNIYREMVLNHMGPRALAQEIVDRCQNSLEKIDAIFLSPDAFAQRTSEDSVAEQMRHIFLENGLPSPQRADDDRVGGWMLMREMLERGELRIGTNCEKLIATLPQMRCDETKVEDCMKFDGDDAADAARYALKSRLGAGRPSLDERVMIRLDSSVPREDIHGRMLAFDRIANEEKKKVQPVRFSRGPRGEFWRR
jgi:phage terminase large subunit